ncbi:MAG: Hint domain-containing protein [Rhodobacteraceae bacterium]|nr:Hint domain-containing protein [Paracoccaceae bacterium]
MALIFNQTYSGHEGNIPGAAGDSFNINNDAFVDITFSDPSLGGLYLDDTVSDLRVTIVGVVTDSTFTVYERGTFVNDFSNDGTPYEYVIIDVQGVLYLFLHDGGDPDLDGTPGFAGAVGNEDFIGGNRNPLDTTPYCFVRGSRISTESGDIPVEQLHDGSFVHTLNNGVQQILWIGKRTMSTGTNPRHIPIRISANALGNGVPKRNLLVSPQHRVLLTDWRAELLFGESKVLVPAKHLVNDDTIRVASDLNEFEYFHILFDSHQTIFSEGLPTESFHPGDMAMKSLSDESRAEVLELFPELAESTASYGPATHRSLKAYEAKALQSA